jgi:hypothetical protein
MPQNATGGGPTAPGEPFERGQLSGTLSWLRPVRTPDQTRRASATPRSLFMRRTSLKITIVATLATLATLLPAASALAHATSWGM